MTITTTTTTTTTTTAAAANDIYIYAVYIPVSYDD